MSSNKQNIQGVRLYDDALPPALRIVPTIYPTSLPIEEMVHQFWNAGEAFNAVEVRIAPPEKPLALLEKLGSSPFERGGFPLVGFLATTYEKVSRYALARASQNHESRTDKGNEAPPVAERQR
jgi:hypothetical protein